MFYQCFGLSRLEFQPWQLFTHALVHGNGIHLAMNALLLLGAATHLEWILGWRRLAGILAAGVLAGGLMHLAWSQSLLVGGSGAAFAVLLCLMTLSPESRWLMPFPVSAKNLGRGLIVASAILLMIHPDKGIPGFSQLGEALAKAGLEQVFRTSHSCHLGGALAGWMIARWVMRQRVSLDRLQRDRAKREG
ncbi:MAG: rhomboid family intramembrane serine protease [Akkermansiaceae bacterium]|nr:rhomboid family intramembrane serine protease [Akkermansiaceae bacterium]